MPPTESDHEAMRQAIAASRRALAEGNKPYGASLLSPEGRLLWTAHNHQVTGDDCTAHAEMVLVREASATLGPQALQGGTVYASGEPCAMCAGAMFWAGVRRVVFAVPQAEMAALLGGPLLPVSCAQTLAGAQPAVMVEGPMLQEEAAAVLRQAAGAAAPVARHPLPKDLR